MSVRDSLRLFERGVSLPPGGLPAGESAVAPEEDRPSAVDAGLIDHGRGVLRAEAEAIVEVATRLEELVEDRRSISTLLQKVENLEAENKRLREERQWVPVGERLPPNDAEVLFTCEIDGSFIGVYMGTSAGRMNDIGSAVVMNQENDGDWMPCTHWMPLPPGPEGDGNG
jgi:hypothetical protein